MVLLVRMIVNKHIEEIMEFTEKAIPEGTAGVYILHFETPFIGDVRKDRASARHYCGSSGDVRGRILDHLLGNGARLTQVANEQGIKYFPVKVIVCKTEAEARTEEKRLKSGRNYVRAHCPECRCHNLVK